MKPEETTYEGLIVQMLGGFTVRYKGQEVALGRNSTSKLIQLLQMVWLQGGRGISKEKLVKDLYDLEEINNINSSFNTLVYRLRQQMKSAGLPEGEYVVRRNGLYVADEKIPVWIDALEFERLVDRGGVLLSRIRRNMPAIRKPSTCTRVLCFRIWVPNSGCSSREPAIRNISKPACGGWAAMPGMGRII